MEAPERQTKLWSGGLEVEAFSNAECAIWAKFPSLSELVFASVKGDDDAC